MKTDILKEYVSAREALVDEKTQLEGRLRQINQALGLAPSALTSAAQPAGEVLRRPRSPISMRAAVVKVTTGHPMTKPEILEAIQKLGFRSASRKPITSLSTLLYGRNPRFRNEDGRFSPLGTSTGAARIKPARGGVKPARKRRVSAAGRAKLAALMKARWADIKKAGGRRLRAV